MSVQTYRYAMASLATIGLNETFDILTHPHRRYALYYLTNESEAVDIDSLATAIAAREGDDTVTGPNSVHKDIETALHHKHLPKLADAGIITYSSRTGSVSLRDIGGLDRFLDDTARIDGYAQSAGDD